MKCIYCAVSVLALAGTSFAGSGTWLNPAGGVWTETSNWVDGNVPSDGGTARMVLQNGTIDFTGALESMKVGTVVFPACSRVELKNGPLYLTAPAKLMVEEPPVDIVMFHDNSLAYSGTLTVSGPGRILISGQQTHLSGKTLVQDGWLRVSDDLSLGPTLVTLVSDAITLDNGVFQNGKTGATVIAPTRGISVTERGGRFCSGYYDGSFVLGSPITGPGGVGFCFEHSPIYLNNPANDWRGDTVVGQDGFGSNHDYDLDLHLGADEVIPHGTGRGDLLVAPLACNCNAARANCSFPHVKTALLDLAGHTETVNAIQTGIRGLISSEGQPGRLILAGDGDSNFRGNFKANVTVEKNGAGKLDLSYGKLEGGAQLVLNTGTAEVASGETFAGSRITYNGGTLKLVPFSGLFRHNDRNGVWTQNSYHEGYPSQLSTSSNTTHTLYTARWTRSTAQTYSFAKAYGGRVVLRLDGNVVLDDANADPTVCTVVKDVVVAAGEHAVEIELWAGADPRAGVFFSGLMYDPENGDFATQAERDRARYFSSDFGDDFRATGEPAEMKALLHLTADCTLDIDPGLTDCVLAGGVSQENGAKLTVVSGHPVRVGSSDAANPAVLDAEIVAANGLRLEGNVWVLAPIPQNIAVEPGSLITYGYQGALANGITLTDGSAGVSMNGVGDGTIVVGAGQTFRFDTQDYEDGQLVDDATHARSYANNIVLDGGTVEFAGKGTNTYTGTITGTGKVVKSGDGTLLFNGDASALTAATEVRCDAGRFLVPNGTALGTATIHTHDGRFGVQDGCTAVFSAETKFTADSGGFQVGTGAQLTICGFVEGVRAISKWGEGTLTFAGEGVDNTFSMHVRGGEVDLAKDGSTAAAAGFQGVELGCVVKITGSSTRMLLAGGVRPNGGVLDLNGHDLTLQQLGDCIQPNPDNTKQSQVINSAVTPAMLTVNVASGSQLYSGSLVDSGLGVCKTGAGSWKVTGLVGMQSLEVQGGVAELVGNGRITARYVRFVPKKTRPDAQYSGTGVQFSELRFLLNGAAVAIPAGATASGPCSGPAESTDKVLDGLLSTKWFAGGSLSTISNTIDFGVPVTFNSYQFGTANDAAGRDPTDWSLQASFDGEFWFEIDHREGISLTSSRSAWDPNVFDLKYGEDCIPADVPVTVASGAVLKLTNLDETLEALAGSGSVFLSQTTLSLTGTSEASFAGAVDGTGDLRLKQASGTWDALDIGASVEVFSDVTDKTLTVAAGETREVLGSLSDGTSQLGVVVDADNATLVRGGNGSDYTGGTRVNRGTLRVCNGLSARYFRFSVTKGTGSASAQPWIEFADLNLRMNGEALPWPEGTTAASDGANAANGETAMKLLDDDTSTKCFWADGANPVTITCPQSMVFNGYEWWTSNDAIQWRRQPVSWTMEYSNDGVSWTTFDEQVDNPDTPNVAKFTKAYLHDDVVDVEEVLANRIQGRFFRFTISKVSKGQGNVAQLSRIDLRIGENVLPWPEGTTAQSAGASGKESASCLIDGQISTKCFWSTGAQPVLITAPHLIAFNGYEWWSANDTKETQRQPVSWTLEYSVDGENWTTFDEQVDNPDTPSVSNLARAYVMNRGGADAGDAVPDGDLVELGEQGVFVVDGAVETVEGFTGPGAVRIGSGGLLIVDSDEDRAFAGPISGEGTLLKAGVGRQSLSGAIDLDGTLIVENGVLDLTGAVLTGVTNIVLCGGTLVGTATVDGDLTVTGRGGEYGAQLTVTGRLNFEGPLMLKLGFDGRNAVQLTAFTYGSTDVANIEKFRNASIADALNKGWVVTMKNDRRKLVVSITQACTVIFVR